MQQGFGKAGRLQRFGDGTAGPSHDGALFHRHQRLMVARHFQQQVQIQRFGPAHVDDRGIQRLRRLQCGVQQAAKSQNRHTGAGTANFAFAKWQGFQSWLDHDPGAGAARVAHGHRMLLRKCRAEQLPALVFISRAGHADIGNATQVGDVVRTGVGGAIGPHQAGPVQSKHHGQVLDSHVMNQLVVGPLQEGGVNRHHWFEPLAGQPSGESDGMLLGNADIKIALRKAALKLHHAGALSHGRCDAHQARVIQRHVAQPLAKHLGEGLLGGRARALQANGRVELARPVVGHRVDLGPQVALTFFGHHVQELRPLQVFDVLERGDQRVKIVPVDGPDVVKAKLFKQRGGHHHALGLLLKAFGQFQQRRCPFEHSFTHTPRCRIEAPTHELRQVAVERTDRRTDAHVVVVQDNQQLAVSHACVVERLKRHAGRQRTVTNHRH